MSPAVALHVRRVHIQQVEAGRELAPAFDQLDGGVLGLIQRGLHRHGPLADEAAARRAKVPPVLPGLEKVVQFQAVELEVEAAGVEVFHEEARRIVGVVGPYLVGDAQPDRGLQRAGTEADRHLLAGFVAVGVGDVGADADLVVG